MMRRLFGVLIGIVGLSIIAYGVLVAYMAVNQRGLQYNLMGEITALADLNLAGAEAIAINTGSGDVVHGWYAPAAQGRPLIVYYKGNSGSFSAEHERFSQFTADGFGFIAIDYRGFPMSPGEISQASVLEDALAAFDFAAERTDRLVIWGRSLGSGPATYVASQRSAEALLLETPFLSAVTVAAERYPYLPVGWVMQDQYRNDEWIAQVDEPVMVAHGTADTVVGFSNGERLFALALNPVELLVYEGGTHGNLWGRGLWQDVRAFLDGEAQ